MAKVLEGTEAWTMLEKGISLGVVVVGVRAGWSGLCTFGSSEVNDVSVFLEHIYLLYCLDWLDIEFLKRGL
jgi:hypothetical protein